MHPDNTKLGNTEFSLRREQYISYQFLKYIRPIWYFHLKPRKSLNVWVDFEKLSSKERALIHYDSGYSHSTICAWDASFQVLMKGIGIKSGENNDQSIEVELTPDDIYRFLRKYYKRLWLAITCVLRIMTFCNPFNEILGLWKTRKVKPQYLFDSHFDCEEYDGFNSGLVESEPFISIILPTFNRYADLNTILSDLEKQSYTRFEVLVIDQSNSFREEFYDNFNLKLQIIRQEEPALWRARNSGINSSQSEYLLFLDDDSRIEPDWILQHLKCIDYFDAGISSGISISRIGAKIPENYSFFRWSDQLDTGNVLIKRNVFNVCGLFDQQFEKMRMGDGEFGVRAYINGFKNISNPKAPREHLKTAEGGLRDMGHWDAFHSNHFFTYRPVPSVFYYWRKYWGNQSALLACCFKIPFSLILYKYKGNHLVSFASLLIFIILFPIIIIQIIMSWVIATKMLKRGDLIDRI